MQDLEEIDLCILKELLKDGRKSFTAIAEECSSSKDVIWKHFKDLTKAGIIVGSTVQFNYQKFGYSGVAMIMISVEPQYVTDVFERLRSMPEIGCFRYYNATYNVGALSQLTNLKDLDNIKETITRHHAINEIKSCIWTDVRNIPENILGDEHRRTEPINWKPPEKKSKPPEEEVTLDKLDLTLVERLTKNGRLPFSQLAQEMECATGTLIRRYEKLTKNNFIKVSIQINPVELGYQAILDLNISLTCESEKIVDEISKIPGVSYIVKISGNYDLLVVALVKDCNDIIAINDEITKIPNIKRMDSTLRKIRFAWPGPRQHISTF